VSETGSEPEGGIKLPEIFHSKWDEVLVRYDSIIAKLNEYLENLTRSFTTKRGIIVDITELGSRMEAVYYKLLWAAERLEYVMEFYGKSAGSLEDRFRAATSGVPDAFMFNADTFFYLAYSALDIVGGIIDLLVETGIEKRRVYFTTVLDYLVGQSVFAGPVFSELKTESDKGWISEFRRYRAFVTHHATMHGTIQSLISGGISRKSEITLFMLPDDPDKIPATYEKKKRELAPYCQEVLLKELDVIKVLFEFVETLIVPFSANLKRQTDHTLAV
jgi:hypothetical protein